jgi:hypothetical protein
VSYSSARVGRLFYSLATDLASQRLIRAMQALANSRLEEPGVTAVLISRAKAVKQFLEACEELLAREIMGQMMEVTDLQSISRDMVARRVLAVLATLPPDTK